MYGCRDYVRIWNMKQEKTEEFLKEIDLSQIEYNIDYWHICNAYETIEKMVF